MGLPRRHFFSGSVALWAPETGRWLGPEHLLFHIPLCFLPGLVPSPAPLEPPMGREQPALTSWSRARTVPPPHGCWMVSAQSQGACLWLPTLQAGSWCPAASPSSSAWGPVLPTQEHPPGLSSITSAPPFHPLPSGLALWCVGGLLQPPLPTLRLSKGLLGPPAQKAGEEPVCGEARLGTRGDPSQVRSLDLGSQEPPNWRLGDRKPAPHPASSPTAGTRPGNHGKGNLGFSCFALNPFLSPSSGQLLGAPHPAPLPPPNSPKDAKGSLASTCPDPRAPPPPSWLRWPLALVPSPRPPGHTDGPAHAHLHPQASPSTRGVERLCPHRRASSL